MSRCPLGARSLRRWSRLLGEPIVRGSARGGSHWVHLIPEDELHCIWAHKNPDGSVDTEVCGCKLRVARMRTEAAAERVFARVQFARERP